MWATTIESCEVCPFLIFPGDGILEETEGVIHAAHKELYEPLDEPTYA